jgi:sugar phosphate isomerase/epimerase
LQALLFGQSELTLFENEDARSRTLDYLNKITQLGARLGARVLVFGSPKNRRTGRLPPKRASEIAISFFREAGRTAAEEGIVVCIEPNPTDYECDFITTSAEGLDLVNKVDNPGIGLHLDAAALTLSGEDLESSLLRCSGSIRHFHISEPFLGPIGQGGVDHPLIASTLRRMGYENWTSIEMRHNSDLPTLQETRRALVYAIDLYGGTKG